MMDYQGKPVNAWEYYKLMMKEQAPEPMPWIVSADPAYVPGDEYHRMMITTSRILHAQQSRQQLIAQYHHRPYDYQAMMKEIIKYYSSPNMITEFAERRPVPGHTFGYIDGITETPSALEKFREGLLQLPTWLRNGTFGMRRHFDEIGQWPGFHSGYIPEIQKAPVIKYDPDPNWFDEINRRVEELKKLRAEMSDQLGIPNALENFYNFDTPAGEVSGPAAGDPVTVTLNRSQHYVPYFSDRQKHSRIRFLEEVKGGRRGEGAWVTLAPECHINDGKVSYPLPGFSLNVYLGNGPRLQRIKIVDKDVTTHGAHRLRIVPGPFRARLYVPHGVPIVAYDPGHLGGYRTPQLPQRDADAEEGGKTP